MDPSGEEARDDYGQAYLSVHIKKIVVRDLRERARGRTNTYCAVSIDGSERFTTDIIYDNHNPVWEFTEPRILSVAPSSVLRIVVLRLRQVGLPHKHLGQYTAPLQSFLNEDSMSHALDTKLSFKEERGNIRIEVEVDTSSFTNRRDSLIDHASSRVGDTAQRYSDDGTDSATQPTGGGNATVLAQAVHSLGHIATSVDNLAEVHPYCKVAWTMLSAVYKAVQNKRELDQRMRKLIQDLADALTYVRECRDLKALPGGTDTVKELARFAIDGAALIDEYMRRNGLARGALAAVTPIDARLQQYETHLRDLINKLTMHVILDVRRGVQQVASQTSVSTTSSTRPVTPPRPSGSLPPTCQAESLSPSEVQQLTSSPDHESLVFEPPRSTRPRLRPETRVTIPLLHVTPAPDHDHPQTQREAAVPIDRSTSIASLHEMFPDVDDDIIEAVLIHKKDDIDEALNHLLEISSSPIRPHAQAQQRERLSGRPELPPRPAGLLRTPRSTGIRPPPLPLTPELSTTSESSLSTSSTDASTLNTPASSYFPFYPGNPGNTLSAEPGMILPSLSRGSNTSAPSPGVYDRQSGGFRVPSPVQKTRSRTDLPMAVRRNAEWVPGYPVGRPE